MSAPKALRPTGDARTARARRTALGFGLFAIGVFAAFIVFTAVTR